MILPGLWKKSLLIMIVAGLAGILYPQSSNYNPRLSTKEKQSIEAGKIVIRELETTPEKGQTIETIGLIHASSELLVGLLSDYEAYPLFMSAVDKIEIVHETGDETTLNYILRPMLGFTKKYRIKIAPTRLDERVWKIEWHLVVWPGLTAMETIGDTRGYWLIIEQSEDTALVQYYVYSDPGPVPFGLGRLVDVLGKDSIEEVFKETRAHAEKMNSQLDP